MNPLLILLFFLMPIVAFGQSDQEKAYDLGMKAIQEMEAGKTQDAILLLEESKKLDPDRIDYPYEIAYAHYLEKDYPASIKILKTLTKHDDVNERIWQLLGNSYDLDGNPDKAINTYESGLEIFPESGILYLERGNMELHKAAYTDALSYYEAGINVQPEFPSNYYWAAKIYLQSTEEMWGLIYGELFINLERNSKRTIEMSKMLFETYQSQISISPDSIGVSFCRAMTLTLDEISENGEFDLPFCMIFEPTMAISVTDVKEININSLDSIRTNFVKTYYQLGHEKDYPNVLFEFQHQLLDEGYLEAYNHWVLIMGDEAGFAVWHEDNADTWDAFLNWFLENPIVIDKDHKFTRGQY